MSLRRRRRTADVVILKRVWIMLTADRRRFGILCTAIGLGLLLWARIIIISNMPRQAIADPESSIEETGAETGETRSYKSRPAIKVMMSERPIRDPFIINTAYFPESTHVVPIGPEQDKSAVQQVEDPELAERRHSAQFRALADQFRLKAVMTGGGMAVLDGRTYRIGDSIRASGGQVFFRLTEVRQRSVILEVGDRQFELKMSSPGRD